MSEATVRYEDIKKYHLDDNSDAWRLVLLFKSDYSKLEQQNKELREDRDNLMALISECIELDYFKDEAILILSDLIVKHSTK